MFVPGRAETSIVEPAERIMLNAASRPVIHSIAEALAAATPHDNLLALAALPGHRRDPAVSAQGIVVPLGDRICALTEEIRGYETPEPRYGEQQTHVAVFPRSGALMPQGRHSIQQCFDSVPDFLALAI